MLIRDTVVWLFVSGCWLSVTAGEGHAAAVPFQERVVEIAGWLTEEPVRLGAPASERGTWDRRAASGDWNNVIPTAERYLGQPVPTLKDALYLEFTRTGDRKAYENDYFRLERQFNALVLAECLENRGRFMPTIEQYLEQYTSCRSWVYPAHDGNLETFEGKRNIIDLGSSRTAFNLATAYRLLGDKLEAGRRAALREAIFERVLRPMKEQVTGAVKREWWFTTTNNWNAVCLANVTGAAVQMVADKRDRALYLAAAEHTIGHFLDGFNADGYCTEGPGYWNYGYGRFVLLCQTVSHATGGRLDLFDSEKAQRPATFGWDIQLVPGVSPAFADCSVTTRPSRDILDYVGRRLGDPKRYGTSGRVSPTQSLFITMLDTLGEPGDTGDAAAEPTLPVRTWFDKTGVLICRAGDAASCRMAAAFKGGHNGEHHNHNDLGSFVITVDGKPLLLDPGSEVYTKFTFSGRRYESDANNSFGHPVPVVAGQLQQTGAAAKAHITETSFTETEDRLTMDLSGGYDVESLESLTRRFDYCRDGEGTVSVTDHVVFSAPSSFETALITYADVTETGDGRLRVTDGTAACRVQIDTGGVPFSIRIEPLTANFRGGQPRRIGITLDGPVQEATVAMDIAAEPLTDDNDNN